MSQAIKTMCPVFNGSLKRGLEPVVFILASVNGRSMSGCRALARLRPPETGESCSFGVFGRNKNTTVEEKVRSPQSADTESSKVAETLPWLILDPRD